VYLGHERGYLEIHTTLAVSDAIEATEQAICNSLFMAETMTGTKGEGRGFAVEGMVK
jgi:L-aminopeptidase/D-esterase-like protein